MMDQCATAIATDEGQSDSLGCPADAYPADRTQFSALLEGTNINPKTFLATDFLNNLNELIMLIGLVADMPEMLDEVREWQPLSYPDHFIHSGFPYRELAIAGWYRADPVRRDALDQLVAAIARQIGSTVERLETCLASGDTAAFSTLCDETRQQLLDVHDWGVGVIQGAEGLNVVEVDALFVGGTA